MFEWFFAPYSSLLLGVEFLLRNPAACSAVEVLRALTLLLCAAAGARIGAHCVADWCLRRGPRSTVRMSSPGCTISIARPERGSG